RLLIGPLLIGLRLVRLLLLRLRRIGRLLVLDRLLDAEAVETLRLRADAAAARRESALARGGRGEGSGPPADRRGIGRRRGVGRGLGRRRRRGERRRERAHALGRDEDGRAERLRVAREREDERAVRVAVELGERLRVRGVRVLAREVELLVHDTRA